MDVNKTSAGSGLFCALGVGGIITNLVDDGKVSGKSYVGCLVKRNLGTIENCINYVTASNDVANGSDGIASGSVKIFDYVNNENLKGDSLYFGGIAGSTSSSAKAEIKIVLISVS